MNRQTRREQKAFFVLVLIIIIASLTPVTAYAQFDGLPSIFPQLPTISVIPQIPLITPEPGHNWQSFIAAVKKIAPIYNYPVNVIIAQGAIESDRGNSQFALDRNNFLGINAVDDDPNQAYSFDNPEQCVIEYLMIIRRNFPEAWAARNDANQVINLLENNSAGMYYASDPDYVSKVTSMPEWSQQ